MISIFDAWQIWRHFRAGEFAQALAGFRENSWLMESGLGLRCRSQAFYRIGMYATAATLPVSASNWHAAWPVAVSLAACGHHERSREILRRLPWDSIPVSKKVALAAALCPFMPDESLRLLQALGDAAPAPLYAGVLLRTGNRLQALQVVRQALQGRQVQKYPELRLFETMAEEDAEPLKQLERLNAFLQSQGVPLLALRMQDQPPAPCNVTVAHALPSVQGPLVSVLMTTYRTGERVSAAIASLLSQSYHNLEIIVVDDASGDATPDIVDTWARRDARVRLIRLPVNGGTYLAKSVGLRQARGEFVTCHDSDDWSHSVKIERQVQPLLEDKTLVATTSQLIRMQDDGMFYARSVYPLARFNPSSPLFRRELVIQRMGGWDMVRTGADSEFYARLRLVFGNRAVKRIAQPLSLGSHREGSLMTASDTGYSDSGVSPQRLEYLESWSHWHLDCLRKGLLPQLPQDLEALAAERCFPAPEKIALTPKQVREAIQIV